MTEAEADAFIKLLHGLNVLAKKTVCQHCGLYGFYCLGMLKREPLTCGRMVCGKAIGEPWAKTTY